MGYAKYYPGLCAELMAFLSGVQINAIHKYLKERDFDTRFDDRLYRFRIIQKFLQTHNLSNAEAVKALTAEYGRGFSINTFKKLKSSVPTPEKELNFSMLDPGASRISSTSVFSDDWEILRAIQRIYLNNVPRFDCDLTFGRGDFYASGVAAPIRCFDKYPVESNLIDAPATLPLDKADELPDESMRSIVIDLPDVINPNDKTGAFSDLADLAQSYHKLLSIAYRKLKPHFIEREPGVLIVKVRDIDYEGGRLWMSKIVTDMATGKVSAISRPVYDELTPEQKAVKFEFELVDKYVHTFRPDTILKKKTAKTSTAHDTFLVFQKIGEDFDVMYDTGNVGIQPSKHITDRNDYTPDFIYGRLLSYKKPPTDSYTAIAVRAPKGNEGTFIDANTEVPAKTMEIVRKAFSFRLPQLIKGGELMKLLKKRVEDDFSGRDPHFKDRSYDEQQRTILKHISTRLLGAGIMYFDYGKSGRVYFTENNFPIFTNEYI